MTSAVGATPTSGQPTPEPWEQEIRYRHHWGQHGEASVSAELERLRVLAAAAGPLDERRHAIAGQIAALEICNWRLEESILTLCSAIGAGEPTEMPIGHHASITPDRWRRVWAYWAALRSWQPRDAPDGYQTLLATCDPDREVEAHVHALLGERSRLKELYVERMVLCLGRFLAGYFPRESAPARGYQAAVVALEEEIRRLDPEGQILDAFRHDGDGRLQPCSHKAFRRYDVVISSIGAGAWRAAMPIRGTDGFERAATLDAYLAPIEAWAMGRPEAQDELAERTYALLGEPDPVKRFLASYLVSLLRCQALAARQRAASRVE